MNRHWWLEGLLPPRRPRWTYGRYDYRRYIGGPSRITVAVRWVYAKLTRTCYECGLQGGQHKMSCDAWWRERRAKRLKGGLDG